MQYDKDSATELAKENAEMRAALSHIKDIAFMSWGNLNARSQDGDALASQCRDVIGKILTVAIHATGQAE